MLDHSKILVWYEVSSQRVSLGEILCAHGRDMVNLWRSTPTEMVSTGLSYRMSLIGDDGRMIANKAISMSTVDKLLVAERGGLASI
jgi:hypothetical protein